MAGPAKKGVLGPALAIEIGGKGGGPGSSAMTPEKVSAFNDLRQAIQAGSPRLFYAALDAVMNHCGYGGGGGMDMPDPSDKGDY